VNWQGFARRIAVELTNCFSPGRARRDGGLGERRDRHQHRRVRPPDPLDCITAASEDDIELNFDDDGMFGGHAIRV
jgi:hypothetical protein